MRRTRRPGPASMRDRRAFRGAEHDGRIVALRPQFRAPVQRRKSRAATPACILSMLLARKTPAKDDTGGLRQDFDVRAERPPNQLEDGGFPGAGPPVSTTRRRSWVAMHSHATVLPPCRCPPSRDGFRSRGGIMRHRRRERHADLVTTPHSICGWRAPHFADERARVGLETSHFHLGGGAWGIFIGLMSAGGGLPGRSCSRLRPDPSHSSPRRLPPASSPCSCCYWVTCSRASSTHTRRSSRLIHGASDVRSKLCSWP